MWSLFDANYNVIHAEDASCSWLKVRHLRSTKVWLKRSFSSSKALSDEANDSSAESAYSAIFWNDLDALHWWSANFLMTSDRCSSSETLAIAKRLRVFPTENTGRFNSSKIFDLSFFDGTRWSLAFFSNDSCSNIRLCGILVLAFYEKTIKIF